MKPCFIESELNAMAKKGTRKSGASNASVIRDYLNNHPDKQPKEIAADLTAQGYKKITPQYVSMVKLQEKKKAGAPTSTRGAAGRGGKVTSDELMAAKSFVKSMGGLSRAKSALDIYARLAD
jgi:hypothetical protein